MSATDEFSSSITSEAAAIPQLNRQTPQGSGMDVDDFFEDFDPHMYDDAWMPIPAQLALLNWSGVGRDKTEIHHDGRGGITALVTEFVAPAGGLHPLPVAELVRVRVNPTGWTLPLEVLPLLNCPSGTSPRMHGLRLKVLMTDEEYYEGPALVEALIERELMRFGHPSAFSSNFRHLPTISGARFIEHFDGKTLSVTTPDAWKIRVRAKREARLIRRDRSPVAAVLARTGGESQ